MLKNLFLKLASGIKPKSAAAQQDGARWAVAGMASLLTGQKLPALSMFGRGVILLERRWRERHPEYTGGVDARVKAALSFYEATHQNPKNRTLHLVGIPMIVGGAAGLIVAPAFRPAWWMSAGLFTLGWQLNIAGHLFYEKNKPAFADDPLAFVVGPLWDARQFVARLRGRRAATATA
ncbi:MAG: DUF962 domain-containing protein [Myxococcota bacterium]